MPEQTVLLKKINHTSLITLNRPDSLNSLNDQLVDELHKNLSIAAEDSDTKAIIITGQGRAFCAGGDLTYLKSLTEPAAAHKFIEKVGALVTHIRAIGKPIIAMVNGAAAGAGFNLALACDIICCSDKAKFAQSFAKVGLVPDCAGMYLLPRIVGLHKAKELMFTADIISAAEAQRLNIVNFLVPADELETTALDIADKLQNSAPLAIKLIKQTLNESDNMTLPALLTAEAALQTTCMQTTDHQEGIKAFLEKRPPEFKGQ